MRYIIVIDNNYMALLGVVRLLRSFIKEADICEKERDICKVLGFNGFVSGEVDNNQIERLLKRIDEFLRESPENTVHIVIDICLIREEEMTADLSSTSRINVLSGVVVANDILSRFQKEQERIEITFESMYMDTNNTLSDVKGIADSPQWKNRKAYSFFKPCDNRGEYTNPELPDPRFGGKTLFEAIKNRVIEGRKEE